MREIKYRVVVNPVTNNLTFKVIVNGEQLPPFTLSEYNYDVVSTINNILSDANLGIMTTDEIDVLAKEAAIRQNIIKNQLKFNQNRCK